MDTPGQSSPKGATDVCLKKNPVQKYLVSLQGIDQCHITAEDESSQLGVWAPGNDGNASPKIEIGIFHFGIYFRSIKKKSIGNCQNLDPFAFCGKYNTPGF